MSEPAIRCVKTPGRFLSLFLSTMGAGFGMARPGYRKAISRRFAERIMLAVSGVNRCAYCSWLHTRTALEKGLSQDEIRGLLEGSLGEVPENETVAILYAQHWSESEGRPSQEARQRVVDHYGRTTTAYIERTIKTVTFGNLCSNTVCARRDNLLGEKPGLCFFLAYLLCLPVAFGIKKRASPGNP